MKRDIVLLLDGGGLAGVFGAGVVTAFQEANLLSRIHSIFSVSAGAHNAAYLLAEQTRLGSTIYYDDLSKNQFARRDLLFSFLRDFLLSRWRNGNILHPFLDFAHLERVEKTTKYLDVEKIANQHIPFQVLVFDNSSGKHRFVDGTIDTVRLLRATSSIGTFCDGPVVINDMRCIDGGTIRTRSILRYVDEHPELHFLYVMNQTRHLEEGFSNRLQEWLYRWSLGWRFGKRIERAYSRHIKNLVSPSEFLSRTNVHAILNPIPTRLLTTDRSKLVQLYEQGIQKGWENIRRLVDQQPTA